MKNRQGRCLKIEEISKGVEYIPAPTENIYHAEIFENAEKGKRFITKCL